PFVPPPPAEPFADLPKVLALAAYPNIAIKITGACTLSHQDFPYPDIWEPLARIFDAFGFDRCLWGTDWTRAMALLTYAQGVDALTSEWSAHGLISSTYADLPFAERFAHVLNEIGPDGYRAFDITLSAPITHDAPMHTGPAVFKLITHAGLLDVVEQLIGPEILSNPIQHVRIKPPERLLNEKFRDRNTMVAATEW